MTKEIIMLTPGTLRVSPRVWEASRPAEQLHHRSPIVADMFAKIRSNLYLILGVSRSDYDLVFFPTTGRGAMEALLSATVIKPDSRTIILSNGRWGNYMAEVGRSYGRPWVAEYRSDAPLPVPKFLPGLVPNIVAFVSHETERGLLNPTQSILNEARRSGAKTIVDITSSLIVDDTSLFPMHADAYLFNASKAIRSVRDVGVVAIRPGLADSLPSKGVYLNFPDEWRRQCIQGDLPRTPFSVGVVSAFLEATRELLEEGVINRRNSIKNHMRAIYAWAVRRKLQWVTNADYMGWATAPFFLPGDWTYPAFRAALLAEGYDVFYSCEGPSGRTFEVSTLGYLSNDDINGFTAACDKVLGLC